MNQIPSTNQPDNLKLRFRLYNWLWIFGIFYSIVPFFWYFAVQKWPAFLCVAFIATLVMTVLRSRFVQVPLGILLALLALNIVKPITLLGTLAFHPLISIDFLINALFLVGSILFIGDPEIRNSLGIRERKKRRLNPNIRYTLGVISLMILFFSFVNLGVMLALDGTDSFHLRFKKVPVLKTDQQTRTKMADGLRRQFLSHSFVLPESNQAIAIMSLKPVMCGKRQVNIFSRMDDQWFLVISNEPGSTLLATTFGFASAFDTNGPLFYRSEWIRWVLEDRLSLLAYVARNIGMHNGKELYRVETPGYVGVATYSLMGGKKDWHVVVSPRHSDSCLSFRFFSKELEREELLEKVKPVLNSLEYFAPAAGYQARMNRARNEARYLLSIDAEDPFWPYTLVDGPMPESVKDSIPLARQDLAAGRTEDAKWRLVDPFYWSHETGSCYGIFGQALLAEGEAKRAVYYLKQALKQHPNDPELKRLLEIAIQDRERREAE